MCLQRARELFCLAGIRARVCPGRDADRCLLICGPNILEQSERGLAAWKYLNHSFTEYLETRAAGSVDRFVLLDAQDWMTDEMLNELWRQITRTARPRARVIFRTAANRPYCPTG